MMGRANLIFRPIMRPPLAVVQLMATVVTATVIAASVQRPHLGAHLVPIRQLHVSAREMVPPITPTDAYRIISESELKTAATLH